MHELALLVFASLGCSLIQGELYVDPVLPYNPGELAVSDRILSPPLSVINPPPMHTRVFFPNPENITDGTTFGVYYFVTGFGGVVQPHLYVDYLTRIAAHGYVVLGSWPLVTGDGIRGINFTAEAHLQNIEYMKENLPIRIREMADFDYLALGGHSAGNGPTFDMAKMDPTKYKVVMNLEPVSGAIHKGVDFSVPSLMLGAELANMTCSITGRDFETFYEKWTCPKVMFEVAGVGHCGFLDQWYWEVCRDFRFCPVEDESMLAPYRTLVEGVTSAMLNTYIQGSHDHLRYVTDPDLIPMALLQHHTDMDC